MSDTNVLILNQGRETYQKIIIPRPGSSKILKRLMNNDNESLVTKKSLHLMPYSLNFPTDSPPG